MKRLALQLTYYGTEHRAQGFSYNLHAAGAVVTRHAVLRFISAVARWHCGARAVREATVVTLALGIAARQNDAVTVIVAVHRRARRN